MNVRYIQALTKQVHTVLIKPIVIRGKLFVFHSILGLQCLWQLSCAGDAFHINQPELNGAERWRDHSDGAATPGVWWKLLQ